MSSWRPPTTCKGECIRLHPPTSGGVGPRSYNLGTTHRDPHAGAPGLLPRPNPCRAAANPPHCTGADKPPTLPRRSRHHRPPRCHSGRQIASETITRLLVHARRTARGESSMQKDARTPASSFPSRRSHLTTARPQLRAVPMMLLHMDRIGRCARCTSCTLIPAIA